MPGRGDSLNSISTAATFHGDRDLIGLVIPSPEAGGNEAGSNDVIREEDVESSSNSDDVHGQVLSERQFDGLEPAAANIPYHSSRTKFTGETVPALPAVFRRPPSSCCGSSFDQVVRGVESVKEDEEEKKGSQERINMSPLLSNTLTGRFTAQPL